ncbi:ABC transporter permease [Verticiella sediminum]|uniref:ABC transporter permease n=1 Tax=Verticiella sediminum TaxID=1247510 RepID=A0A556AW12_9BURK|nr:ABC transporter permease [Verticiella sediminum]TSH97139.1 ABC transporter permease [Verticiella sediminum]
MPKFVLLWTDAALFLLMLAVLGYAWRVHRSPNLRATWSRVLHDTPAMCAAVVLLMFSLIAILDSVHYRPALPPVQGAAADAPRAYAPVTRSLLDAVLERGMPAAERSWSAPLAIRQFTKETELIDGEPVRDFPRLVSGGAHLGEHTERWVGDVLTRAGAGLAAGAAAAVVLALLTSTLLAMQWRLGWREACRDIAAGVTRVPWRAMLITAACVCLLVGLVAGLGSGYHVLGTDRTGNDVLVQALKSVRTALVIGSLTTIAMLPFAIVFGLAAGYFKGWVDDIIQYIYTTLTSIPGVLLIAACVLMLQVFIDTHPEMFTTAAERADVRLFMLCVILGFTGWAGLCRLLRAEALKLSELEYVQAARAFGVGHWRIIVRHLLPNVMHIVLITVVLEFSSLVLYEAVLSYLGVGVDPSMNSFGSMIDMARTEMSRDPMIWWNLLAAFVFMLALVLAANLFSDAVRDAFDPRGGLVRARRRRVPAGGRA